MGTNLKTLLGKHITPKDELDQDLFQRELISSNSLIYGLWGIFYEIPNCYGI